MKKYLKEFDLVRNQQKTKKEILNDYQKLKDYEIKLYKYKNVLDKHRQQLQTESNQFYKDKKSFELENLIIKSPLHYYYYKYWKKDIIIFILNKKNKETIIRFKHVKNGTVKHDGVPYSVITEYLTKAKRYYVGYFREDILMQINPLFKIDVKTTATNFKNYTNQKMMNLVFFPKTEGEGFFDKLLSPYGLIFVGIMIACVLGYLHITGVVDLSGLLQAINPSIGGAK